MVVRGAGSDRRLVNSAQLAHEIIASSRVSKLADFYKTSLSSSGFVQIDGFRIFDLARKVTRGWVIS
jgi:hypothetical protein